MARPRTAEVEGDQDAQDFLELMDSHRARGFARVMRMLPSEPRCRLCHAPFAGPGGRVMRRFGFGPSRKNPALCNTCFEKAPMGGAEMEIGVLFADVRGFTALAERLAPEAVAGLLNRFYAAASKILTRSAIIDKMVGDEVMALYLPMLLSERWEDELVRDATELLEAVADESPAGAWLPLGVGIDLGRAYVGNVGAGDVKDFTALGDVVNTAARLQSVADAGQLVMSETLYARLADPPAGATAREVELKGKAQPLLVRVV
jgi:adenylate cyclase